MHFVSRLRPGRLSSRTTAILGVKDNFSLSMPTQHNRSFGKKMIKKKSPEDEASEEDEIDAELNQNWGEYKLTPQQQQVFDHYYKKENDIENLVKIPDPPSQTVRLYEDFSKSVYIPTKEITKVNDHKEEDVGKYYQISPETLEKLPITYVQSRVKNTQPLVDEYERTLNYNMTREVPFNLVQSLKTKEGYGKITGVVGRKGTGKTACLNYLAQYGLEEDLLLISTQGLEFTHELKGFLESNDDRKEGVEIFDQTAFTQDWFVRLLENNGDILKQITLKSDYNDFDFFWEEGVVYDETYKKPEDTVQRTLYDLVDLGSRNISYSSDLLYKFVEEIYQIQEGEAKVLILVDDMNFWDHPSEFLHPYSVKPLPARQLSLVDALSKFTVKAPAQASVVFSLSQRGFMRNLEEHLSHTDQVVEMKPYTDKELLTTVRHYKISNLLEVPRHKMDMKWVAWMKGYSGAVPGEVFHLSCIL